MNTIPVSHPRTRMIAHRGLSGLETENTAAAFVAAGNRSYFGIETDVHKTADGHFVVIHDENTHRVSGTSCQVEKTKLKKLRSLTLKNLGGEPRADLKIPTLQEYIQICKRYQKAGVLELKARFSSKEIKQIVSIIQKEEYLEHIIFISFDLENLVLLRELLPKQPAQLLTSDAPSKKTIQQMQQYRLGLNCNEKQLSKKLVEEMHHLGIEVNCWTCNDPGTAQMLISWGVDYITTNILE